MFINSQGKAMSYQTYYIRFVSLVQDHLRPLLLSHEDPECRIYGQLLCENTLGPHSLRHWFSVQLALRGEDIANLQFWRGDKSPESAFHYLQNKGDLVRELSAANDMLAKLILQEGERIFE
jgi:integrase